MHDMHLRYKQAWACLAISSRSTCVAAARAKRDTAVQGPNLCLWPVPQAWLHPHLRHMDLHRPSRAADPLQASLQASAPQLWCSLLPRGMLQLSMQQLAQCRQRTTGAASEIDAHAGPVVGGIAALALAALAAFVVVRRHRTHKDALLLPKVCVA